MCNNILTLQYIRHMPEYHATTAAALVPHHTGAADTVNATATAAGDADNVRPFLTLTPSIHTRTVSCLCTL